MNNSKQSIKCDYKKCSENATVKGHVYGHIKGSGEKDSLIQVHACDKHKNKDGFYFDEEL